MKAERLLGVLFASSSASLLTLLLLGASTAAAAFQQILSVPTSVSSALPSRHIINSPCAASMRLAFGGVQLSLLDAHAKISSRFSTTLLRSGGSSDVESDETETAMEDPAAAVDDASSAAADSSPAPKVEEEDPELVALKQEIANLESALKAKKRALMSTRDGLDEYSKQGYARRVAEMENMRRARSSLNKNNRSYATATVVSEFVPSYDKLLELKAQHSDMEFAKQYDALAGTLRSAFGELGVQDYAVQFGDKVNVDTMNVVEQRNNDDMPKGVVLEVISNRGLELQGNVVRRADVVASLGPEAAEEAQIQEEEEAGEGGASASPEDGAAA